VSLTPEMRTLWLATVGAIAAIVVIGIVFARTLPAHAASPIWARLVVAAIVTILVAVAKVLGGPRAAAVTGVAGVLVGVVLLLLVW
jgi:hypothetical protein